MHGGRHCYPGSEVLINSYDIRDKELLEKFEIQKVATKLLGLDIRPERIECTFDVEHLCKLHQYLFGDIYAWAGTFRDENIYKSESVLSGASVGYADCKDIPNKLKTLFEKYQGFDWCVTDQLIEHVSDFLLTLWCIHPFREGNTRTCITFLWHYLQGHHIDFQLALLRNNPMYVRDALVMAWLWLPMIKKNICKESYQMR